MGRDGVVEARELERGRVPVGVVVPFKFAFWRREKQQAWLNENVNVSLMEFGAYKSKLLSKKESGSILVRCELCEGSGWVKSGLCFECGGKGLLRVLKA